MKIINGTLGGRVLHVPTNMPFTRPTTQVAKEALFNVLNNHLDFTETNCLDLFSGTGAISYELASRGSSNITMIEQDAKMLAYIKSSLLKFKINNVTLFQMDVFKFLTNCVQSFDFIFAGPPYALENIEDIPKLIFDKTILADGGIFVLEHTPKNKFADTLNFRFQKNYGTTVFSFFCKKAD